MEREQHGRSRCLEELRDKMPQVKDDCFAYSAPLISITRALEILDERIGTIAGTERADLKQATGRVLAEDVTSRQTVPPHDNAAVDGYCIRFDDLDPKRETRFRIVGRAAAGHPSPVHAQPGEAVRIFTGAPVPSGFDTVVMQEDCQEHDGTVLIPAGIKQGANYRFAGEDIRAGAIILQKGLRLRPQDVGLAAAGGCKDLDVFKPLKVAVFSTGDELFDPGEALPDGGIYDSNRMILIGMLKDMGCSVEDLGILHDRLDVIQEALTSAATRMNLVVTSGGMSVGDEDHVKTAVHALGDLHFWQLAIKPGRPLGLGQVCGTPFVGLPGNPVGMMVTFLRIARPMILKLSGRSDVAPHFYRVPAGFSHRKKTGRREWVRARLVDDGAGMLTAHKFPKDGSGILSSMVEADGLVELPEDLRSCAPGDLVDFLPFEAVSG